MAKVYCKGKNKEGQKCYRYNRRKWIFKDPIHTVHIGFESTQYYEICVQVLNFSKLVNDFKNQGGGRS